MARKPPVRGRPPVASRELLQEAAFELFLEQGFENTAVAEIAQRAGVGRSTFFNHFATKADVFWSELDDAAAALEAELAHPAARGFDAVRRALYAASDTFGPDSVPLVLTQHELIGSPAELQSAAVTRLAGLASLMARRLESDGTPIDASRAAAFALVAASVAAATTWARAGVERGGLTPYVRAAIEPVLAGFIAR